MATLNLNGREMLMVTHKAPTGHTIEYRRNPYDPVVLHLEHRVLRSDGTPYDDQWFRVSDGHLLDLQHQPGGVDVVDRLMAST